MKSRFASSLLCILLAVPGCCLLGEYSDWGCESWMANVYPNASYDDVYQIAFNQLDRDYAMSAMSNRNQGVIETEWDSGMLSDSTRMMKRERVIVNLDADEEGVTLKLRVQCQVRERTGLLTPDDEGEDDWSYTLDDFDRARVLFGRIQALLDRGGPSPEFHERPPLRLDGLISSPAR